MEANTQQQTTEGEKENLFFDPKESTTEATVPPVVKKVIMPEAKAPEQKAPEAKAPAAPKTAVAVNKAETELVEGVLIRINELQEAGDLKLPANYAVGNQLKLAWLAIGEVENKAGKKALDVCTKTSIANALMEMCINGLSVMKKQCDFIIYDDKLTMQMEYHGVVALAKRYGGVKRVTANCIYEDDKFTYTIDPKTGFKRIIEHQQNFENVDMNKIRGAYATLTLEDGETFIEIMNMNQIRQAWEQGYTRGQSPAHKKFPDQMSMKTVIGRACKLFVSTSDDAGLFGNDTTEAELTQEKPSLKKERENLKIEDAEAEVII